MLLFAFDQSAYHIAPRDQVKLSGPGHIGTAHFHGPTDVENVYDDRLRLQSRIYKQGATTIDRFDYRQDNDSRLRIEKRDSSDNAYDQSRYHELNARARLKGSGTAAGYIRLPVYRVYGGQSTIVGRSYTIINPRYVPFFRKYAGLPDINSGEYLLLGVSRIKDMRNLRPALPLDGNPGHCLKCFYSSMM